MTKHVLLHDDYVKRKKQFEEKGRAVYLANDFENFTSLTAEFMAFVDTYIDGMKDKCNLYRSAVVEQRHLINDYETFFNELKENLDDRAKVARGGD